MDIESRAAVRLSSVSKKFTLALDQPRTLQEKFTHLVQLGRRPQNEPESFWAVRDVTLEVPPGQMLGLIGENGSGKSTVLKLLSGILRPTIGQVFVDGRIAAMLELGTGFHPDLTGRENIFLNGSIMGLKNKEIRQHLPDIVSFADIGKFIDTPLRHYSSGMQVRLGFAIATTLNPQILLIDEVLAVGDRAFQERCFSRIRQLYSKGVTMIFVSHDLDTVRKLCDQVVWMDKGNSRSQGTPDAVIAEYLRHVMIEMQSDATLQMHDNHRWGTGEAIITKVEFLDETGRKTELFNTGQPLVARLHYEARHRVEKPAFGVAIYGPNNEHITGPNTANSDLRLDSIEGKGHVDFVVDSLPLMPGRYQFTVAIYDFRSIHPYDHQQRLHSFTVLQGDQPRAEGLMWIPCAWRHQQAASRSQD